MPTKECHPGPRRRPFPHSSPCRAARSRRIPPKHTKTSRPSVVFGEMVDLVAGRPQWATSRPHGCPGGLVGRLIWSCFSVSSSAAPETGMPRFC
jgi:hypothetical protein